MAQTPPPPRGAQWLNRWPDSSARRPLCCSSACVLRAVRHPGKGGTVAFAADPEGETATCFLRPQSDLPFWHTIEVEDCGNSALSS